MRQRGTDGTLTTMARENYAEVLDATKLDKEALWPFISLEAKEKADIMALLTDAQKKELDQVAADDKKEAAERRASGHEKGATTKPVAEK